MPPATDAPASVWDDVVGQPAAVEQLRHAAAAGAVHAYLFLGPPGSTKVEASRAFAARLLTGGDDADTRDARLVRRGEHPDVREFRRVGPAISADQAREIVRLAWRAPVEGERKVLILDEFHLVRPDAAAMLLKTIEEPPPSTTFVILADLVPHELVTISSRCAVVEFRPIGDDEVAAQLRLGGADPATAAAGAAAARGDLDRARVLATDSALSARQAAFAGLPARLDGTGRTAVAAARELLDLIDGAAQALEARQAEEVAELEARIAELGERGSGRKQLEDRHRRELRRHRTDELRSGLATLAATYRDAVTADPEGSTSLVEAVHRIHGALEALERNPNERLLLESLLWSLPSTSQRSATQPSTSPSSTSQRSTPRS